MLTQKKIGIIGMLFMAIMSSVAGQQAGVGMDINPHPPFVEEKNLWQIDDAQPLENQVMQITGELYDQIITSRWLGKPLNNGVPWVLLFADPERIDDKRSYQNYRRLAAKYQGKVRFGWVLAQEEELLSASFDSRFLPQTFYIKDGIAYWYRDFQYEMHLSAYIDGNKQGNSTTSFAQPRRFVTLQLYLYTYPRKEIR